jgi:hypothetical protein
MCNSTLNKLPKFNQYYFNFARNVFVKKQIFNDIYNYIIHGF